MNPEPRVVIIGAGFGGLDAARALARAPVRVTVLDRHNHHVFQPLLYQVATAALSPGDIASPIRWILRRQKNVEVLLAEARAIDPAARLVRTDRDPVPYDYLIVATGATHAYFGHPEWEQWAPGLKTLDDALEMRRRVLLAFEAAEREPDPEAQRRLLTFVIVGGGPTGVELAGALAEIARQSLRDDFRRIRPESARIVLIEGGPHLLATFPEQLRTAARASLERLGVEVRTGSAVTGIDADGVTVGNARDPYQGADGDLGRGRRGVTARGVARRAARSRGPRGRRADAERARASRDLRRRRHLLVSAGRQAPAGRGPGRQAAGRARGEEHRRAPSPGSRSSRSAIFNFGNVATIGRGSAVVDIGPVRASGWLAWVFWLFLHIFWLIGFRNRVAVLGEWAWAYVTFQRRIRLITGGKLWPSA